MTVYSIFNDTHMQSVQSLYHQMVLAKSAHKCKCNLNRMDSYEFHKKKAVPKPFHRKLSTIRVLKWFVGHVNMLKDVCLGARVCV